MVIFLLILLICYIKKQGDRFVELIPRQSNVIYPEIEWHILEIPQPNIDPPLSVPLTSIVDLLDAIRSQPNQQSFDEYLISLNHTLAMDRLPPIHRTVYGFNNQIQATGIYRTERIQPNIPILPRRPAMGRRPLPIPNTANARQLIEYFDSQLRPLTDFEREVRDNLDISDPTVFRVQTVSRQSRNADSPIVITISNLSPIEERIPESSVDLMNEMGNLHKKSYEALVSQLYGFPVQLPEFLMMNGMRVNFISYDELTKIQIERWIVDPILQSWSGPPVPYNTVSNKIVTIFGKNGITYLSKVLLDPNTNKIFKPI